MCIFIAERQWKVGLWRLQQHYFSCTVAVNLICDENKCNRHTLLTYSRSIPYLLDKTVLNKHRLIEEKKTLSNCNLNRVLVSILMLKMVKIIHQDTKQKQSPCMQEKNGGNETGIREVNKYRLCYTPTYINYELNRTERSNQKNLVRVGTNQRM